MIQLANDPDASRSFERAATGGDAKGAASEERRVRTSGHAWPFLSRYAEPPARKENKDKPAAQQSGS
jgi:hypothetical protein